MEKSPSQPQPTPAMHHEIRVKHIAGGSLFRLLLLTSCVIFLPVYFLLGITGAFGLHTVVDANGHFLTGVSALKPALGAGFLLVLLFTCGVWCVVYGGMRLISLKWPIVIKYHPHPGAVKEKDGMQTAAPSTAADLESVD
ncbi:MAG TPA: hypothetical protein VG733_04850 [Chthoniobacteraceae bacterium]|nr:hypothetical protein [Chthoniobacteraceae bacterium]